MMGYMYGSIPFLCNLMIYLKFGYIIVVIVHDLKVVWIWVVKLLQLTTMKLKVTKWLLKVTKLCTILQVKFYHRLILNYLIYLVKHVKMIKIALKYLF